MNLYISRQPSIRKVPAIAMSVICALCALEIPPGQAQHPPVPEGQYLSPEAAPGKSSQKGFSLNSSSPIGWIASSEGASEINGTGTQDAGNENINWQSHNYPVIKWKSRRVQGTLRAGAELITSCEYGMLKYQIILGKLKESSFLGLTTIEKIYRAAATQGLVVSLLDKDGFMLAEFRIPGNVLLLDEDIIEGRSATPLPEEFYSRVRDWRIR